MNNKTDITRDAWLLAIGAAMADVRLLDRLPDAQYLPQEFQTIVAALRLRSVPEISYWLSNRGIKLDGSIIDSIFNRAGSLQRRRKVKALAETITRLAAADDYEGCEPHLAELNSIWEEMTDDDGEGGGSAGDAGQDQGVGAGEQSAG